MTVLASAALLVGAAFMLVAAVGVVRLPDLYTRMQAATKASTMGVVGMMCAVGVAYADASATVRAVLIAGFFLLTSPVAAHAIARSAHTRGVPLAPGTRVDAPADVHQSRQAVVPREGRPPPHPQLDGEDEPAAAASDAGGQEVR